MLYETPMAQHQSLRSNRYAYRSTKRRPIRRRRNHVSKHLLLTRCHTRGSRTSTAARCPNLGAVITRNRWKTRMEQMRFLPYCVEVGQRGHRKHQITSRSRPIHIPRRYPRRHGTRISPTKLLVLSLYSWRPQSFFR